MWLDKGEVPHLVGCEVYCLCFPGGRPSALPATWGAEKPSACLPRHMRVPVASPWGAHRPSMTCRLPAPGSRGETGPLACPFTCICNYLFLVVVHHVTACGQLRNLGRLWEPYPEPALIMASQGRFRGHKGLVA